MSGICRELAAPTKQAEVLNKEIIVQVASQVKWQNSFQVCCYSAVLTGFYLCIRVSNLVPTSHPQFDPTEQLTRGKVSIDENLILGIFDIEWTKTIQFRQRNVWLAVRPASRPDICPLATLTKLFEMVPAHDDMPCFCFKNRKNVVKTLTYKQLSEQLKIWIAATGRDQARYTLHGMHRGSTTHALNSGIDDLTVKLLGNWSSDCYQCYVDLDLDKHVQAAVTFAKNM